MTLLENLRLALDALRANVMRTLLTLLGVIVGVASVIAVIAIARGGQQLVIREVEGLGSGMVWVEPNWAQQSDFTRLEYLDARDVEAIGRLPGVADVSPMLNVGVEARAGTEARRLTATGVAAAYAQVRNLRLQEGRFFSEAEAAGGARVAVLGDGLRQRFFPEDDPVGQTLWINGRPFVVVGVLERSTGLMASVDAGQDLLVPHTTVRRLSGIDDILALFVRPEAGVDVTALVADIRAALERNHAPDRFVVNSLDQVLGAIRRVTDVMTLVVAGIAAVALLVGGIGIMNIMLVSVTERTREIGLRKAIGARRCDILSQFLIEAVVVSSLGGLLGILFGGGIVALIGALTSLPSLLTPGSILLAFGFAAGVGIVFGVYPANKAARLDPIDALRYE